MCGYGYCVWMTSLAQNCVNIMSESWGYDCSQETSMVKGAATAQCRMHVYNMVMWVQ